MIFKVSLLSPELLHIIIVICFLPSTVKIWNTLPNSVESAISIAKFKKISQNNNLVGKTKSGLYNPGKRNLKIFRHKDMSIQKLFT